MFLLLSLPAAPDRAGTLFQKDHFHFSLLSENKARTTDTGIGSKNGSSNGSKSEPKGATGNACPCCRCCVAGKGTHEPANNVINLAAMVC